MVALVLPEEGRGQQVAFCHPAFFRRSARGEGKEENLDKRHCMSSSKPADDNRIVLAEVRSVFNIAMGGNATFQFMLLQLVGGGCRTLYDPQTSSPFEWTAKDVA